MAIDVIFQDKPRATDRSDPKLIILITNRKLNLRHIEVTLKEKVTIQKLN